MAIRNPILPGFHPDPSICRVGETYYIATSTFEWYPGVRIYASEDLANWRLVAMPLNRAELLDMRGNPDSCGIWAPCLSHDGDAFWLVYTDVKRLDGSFKDAHNYITRCETIDGEWCDPWYVNSSGFDPSLFHDDDGQKWFLNMRWNHRGQGTGGNPEHASFDGILLQRWSPDDGLSGDVTNIYDGSPRGLTEAPHLFKRDGWYYLTVAEGGTGYQHAVTMARSRDIHGPYEQHPETFLMTAADAPDHPIQRTGHGQYVESPDGQAWHTFLMGRPIKAKNQRGKFCPLGRETGIERCVWREGWLYLEGGGMLARETVPASVEQDPQNETLYEFSEPTLHADFQWLRTPYPDRIFNTRASGLTLIGRESLGSWFEQSLVARRQQHLIYRAESEVVVQPTHYQHAAGLTTYYNRTKFHALLVSWEPGIGRCLRIESCAGDWPDGGLTRPIEPYPLPDADVRLAVEVDRARQQFFVSVGGGDWRAFGPVLDASVISDEGGRGEHASFTGAFVGVVAYDTSGGAGTAHFPWFRYSPGDDKVKTA